ncbi:DUF4404 family protein [Aliikangiella coralliicola]|uniref:DUF4404 family protein n=1 Tax=Aliikangiella coralliicola TaxID=2592383 RepID=A0A545UK60_9GAMM|nr:DUF4404 family protein [Aliikangiella coralliicola]TQV89855.1 DUF4404 family protein [Aliikangiella coralliicola]
MDKQQMAEILYEIRTELAGNEKIEHHQRQLMEALAGEIEERIGSPEVDMSGDQFLLTRLKDLAKDFEAEHPKFTNIVGRLSDLLARMGI